MYFWNTKINTVTECTLCTKLANTNIFLGYLAFTKHKYYIRNATLKTIAGHFFLLAIPFFHPLPFTFISKWSVREE